MNQADLIIKLAKKLKKEKRTKEEIIQSFVDAGILTLDGKFTKNYPTLQKAVGKVDFTKIDKYLLEESGSLENYIENIDNFVKEAKKIKMENKRFVDLKEHKNLCDKRDELDAKILSLGIFCRICGDTAPKNGFYPLITNFGYTCNRCYLTDEEYEDRFDEPKEMIKK